ncbi:adenosylcobinamide kinase [Halomonas campisalis]|uniref:Adenosylcobinamide kinase n=1 Tax=Billgrantia campisalis TaxID=74661 RepID=A0ABS9PF51_9GAMM|nr:bifunctional adenosylcobinamide kinase/adenosylcobinamide-phosphate guanylyltransferase [Halomonas campisalis]MCG6659887.1 adenosylcobinamide kinase [Halomonas campisalis]MDR5865075.1 bifunctional adenosylcobinamide kinase/adenosylcobinamide-phosphate guanylyltransferase [Halomonas campisalis]
MQLFIGGACAGKRDAVAARFPAANWCRLVPSRPLGDWRRQGAPGTVRVITGWLGWLQAALAHEPDDDALRNQLAAELDALCAAECRDGHEVVLILPEVGRGIVPMAASDRRLRDLAGWLAQDAAARAERVWYVRHGLLQVLRQVKAPANAR